MGKKRDATASHGDSAFRSKKKVKHNFDKELRNAAATSAPEVQTFPARPDWHAVELPALISITDPIAPSTHTLQALHDHATSLLEAESRRHASGNKSNSSSAKFMKELMESGTWEDKVSALTLVVQESPLHNTKAFENLLNMARKKSRTQAIMALGALKDLLGAGVVLPPDRKLKAFSRQPGLISALQGKSAQWKVGDRLPGNIQEIHLLSWAYEDWLKRTYFDMLKVLESWCNDEVEYSRKRAITFVWELLKEKSEQEENLLRLLVNKLGDTDKDVASRASYLLLQLLVVHPVMKNIVIGTIESDLLFKPSQSIHAKYYAIITLNQTQLSQQDQGVAEKLLDIYFSIFVGLLKNDKQKNGTSKSAESEKQQGGGGKPGKKARQKQKEKESAEEVAHQLHERLIAQILTGVNRAYPYADAENKTVETHLDTLYRITHSSNFNTGVQALILIYQISAAKQQSTDRYYRTLYESLLDPRLLTSSKQIMYLNLLYRSLKADINVKRVKAFVKRLLQIIALHDPPFVCGVLFLIHELETTFPSLKSMLTDPEMSVDDEEERFEDVPEEGSKMPTTGERATKLQNDDAYNPRKRDPEYSNADRSCLWEIIPLVAHYHPSVSLFASRILQSEAFDRTKPDPSTFTLIHFLDRFIYRQARSKASGLRGSSLMQPLAGTPVADMLYTDRSSGKTRAALNKEEFWSSSRDTVRADEVFFHEYFEKSGQAQKKSRAEKRAQKDEDPDASTDDEEEGQIWKALVGSRPEVENADGDVDEDEDDVDIADFMDDDDDDDDEAGSDAGVPLDDMDGVTFHGFEEDEAPDAEGGAAADADGAEDDDDGFDMTALEDDDDEAFFGSDDEIPEDIPMPEKSIEDVAKDLKSKDRKKRKKSIRSLPIFASAEDYMKLMAADEEENL